eukprot:jgi/Mesen1/9176/ME000591S08499
MPFLVLSPSPFFSTFGVIVAMEQARRKYEDDVAQSDSLLSEAEKMHADLSAAHARLQLHRLALSVDRADLVAAAAANAKSRAAALLRTVRQAQQANQRAPPQQVAGAPEDQSTLPVPGGSQEVTAGGLTEGVTAEATGQQQRTPGAGSAGTRQRGGASIRGGMGNPFEVLKSAGLETSTGGKPGSSPRMSRAAAERKKAAVRAAAAQSASTAAAAPGASSTQSGEAEREGRVATMTADARAAVLQETKQIATASAATAVSVPLPQVGDSVLVKSLKKRAQVTAVNKGRGEVSVMCGFMQLKLKMNEISMEDK